MTVAIVTARGGSTRTPNKNGRLLCNVPLLAWSIIQAQTAHEIDAVFLTTDSEAYADIGKFYGAEVIMRPVWDNGITAGVPFLHALNIIETNYDMKPDILVTLLPTSPLRKPGQLDRMIEVFKENQLDYLCDAAPFKETFILKHVKGSYYDRFQTQSLGDLYQAQMQIADKFWKYSKLGGGTSVGTRDYYFNTWSKNPQTDIEIDTKPVDKKTKWNLFPIEDWQCFEIDYPHDFEVCEALMEKMILKGRNSRIYGYVPLWKDESMQQIKTKYAGNSNQQ